MSPDRLEDLVQISSERDIANNIELSKLVQMFKRAKPRKLPLPLRSYSIAILLLNLLPMCIDIIFF